MLLEVHPEVLIYRFVDRDLESLADGRLEVFNVLDLGCGDEGIIHVYPHVNDPRGSDDLEKETRVVDGSEVIVFD